MAEAVAARAPDLGHALGVKLVAEARRLRIDRRRGLPAPATRVVHVELGAKVCGVGAIGSGQVEVVAQVLGDALSADREHEKGVVVALERLREVLVDRSLGRDDLAVGGFDPDLVVESRPARRQPRCGPLGSLGGARRLLTRDGVDIEQRVGDTRVDADRRGAHKRSVVVDAVPFDVNRIGIGGAELDNLGGRHVALPARLRA
eukprot:7389434-Prymnesium_polylepis.3